MVPGTLDYWLRLVISNQVESELGLNRTMDRSDIIAEDDPIKFRNHLTRIKFSQGSPLFSRRTE